MFSFIKIITFALLTVTPFASALSQPAPVPNAVDVAQRAAPTADAIKILTDAKGAISASCSQITSSPGTVTAALVSSVTAQINVTLVAAIQALTNDELTGFDGDITGVASIICDITTLTVDTINTAQSTAASAQAAVSMMESTVNALVSQLVIKTTSATSGVVAGVGKSLVALIGCSLKSSGIASKLFDFKLNLVASACGLANA